MLCLKVVFDKIFELKDGHPYAFVILGGDFNVCLTENDSKNRQKTRQEKWTAVLILFQIELGASRFSHTQKVDNHQYE